jgi:YfiH family protein
MNFLRPDWPAPPQVRAASTTRQGGVSRAPFHSFNLGGHVGDAPADVAANRKQLRKTLSLPAEPYWLNQIHGTVVVDLDGEPGGLPEADASITSTPNTVCAVLTADCLPILFCNQAGTQVAAAHAGWRGLAAGVLEATVASFTAPPEQIMVWMGPAIGPQAFEVGDEVRQAFCDVDPVAAQAFVAVQSETNEKKWLADVYQLARQRLAVVGVNAVYGGGRCTFTEADDFYSFRRDGKTGRMASLVWVEGGD